MRTCRLSASALASSDNDPIATNANVDLTAGPNMMVVCTRGSNPSIAVDAGSLASGTLTLRAMSKSGGRLSYEVRSDSGLTQIRAESGSSVLTLGTISSERNQTIPIRGRIPAGQNVPVGSYNDAVIVTVNF